MRLAVAAWLLQLRLLSRSPFFVWMALLTPLVYCSLAAMMSGGHASTRTIIGAGLMGAWSTTLFGAAEALFMQRFSGTLELLVGGPRSLVAPVLGFSLATVTLGVYSVGAAWLWALLVFRTGGASEDAGDAGAMVIAAVVAMAGLVAVGVFLAALYVVTRKAMELTNILEYPIWLICGVLVPSATLWPPLAIVGRVLPLGWATPALDLPFGTDWAATLGVSLLLTAGYFAAGVVLLRRVDALVRVRGTLRLR
ncbi:hypothetical protein LLS1_30040 [Leifsonia sp. LS1]|uniref:hypothetical protein n=1 Tax=Leifsonia sp. LS1 TaxID=2828483 RepID=UPI001CFEE129|nr:hypothetical protein [Leifsonia sp. LS1]GIT81335.1 hypothetical protein LLS1_30040 [Leifsonia sp. LS1]